MRRPSTGFLAPLIAATFFAESAAAKVIDELDKCLADPSQAQAVFTERYPHERCELNTTCDPKLVQSAETLARQRCRLAAIDSCNSLASSIDCARALEQRWDGKAKSLHANITARWSVIDRSKVSPFAIRRFDNSESVALVATCEELDTFKKLTDLPEGRICALYLGFSNIMTMESLSTYLADQEARR